MALPQNEPSSVWDKPHIKGMLSQPIGAPVHLSRQEALEIVLNSAGCRPDLPDGAEFVRKIRPVISRSFRRKLIRLNANTHEH